MKKRIAIYNGREYDIVNPPQADNDELANSGDRLVFHHDRIHGGSTLSIAPKGVLHAGWVLGVFID